MKNINDENRLNKIISKATDLGKVEFDSQKWKKKYLSNQSFVASRSNIKHKPYQNIWRLIMENKVTKYSAAAVVTLAFILVLLNPFGSMKHSVALADVQKKVEQVNTMILRGTKKFTCVDDPNIIFEFDIVKYISKEHGFSEKGYVKDELIYSITFNLPKKQALISFPSWKKILKFPNTETALKIMEKLSPDGMIELLLSNEHEELGTKDLNGVEVEVFAFEDADTIKGIFPKTIFNIEKYKGTVWIGTKNLLPVRIEGDISIGKCLMTAYTNFNLYEVVTLDKYNIELDKDIFSTEVPEGFTELKLTDILPFIPVKVKATAAGLGIIPIGLIIWKRQRRKKTLN